MYQITFSLQDDQQEEKSKIEQLNQLLEVDMNENQVKKMESLGKRKPISEHGERSKAEVRSIFNKHIEGMRTIYPDGIEQVAFCSSKASTSQSSNNLQTQTMMQALQKTIQSLKLIGDKQSLRQLLSIPATQYQYKEIMDFFGVSRRQVYQARLHANIWGAGMPIGEQSKRIVLKTPNSMITNLAQYLSQSILCLQIMFPTIHLSSKQGTPRSPMLRYTTG
eukprot:TRINITY_DN1836_c1_g1_i23.p2 TRINITY_DN1836_c1_g1~~TRINITY_DN1836_c1_g1_i23.p2  ORF type:complete len:221 (-),score=9.29 TRINITY_DN1836_c1_g1_i23:326-988(-)